MGIRVASLNLVDFIRHFRWFIGHLKILTCVWSIGQLSTHWSALNLLVVV